MYVSSDEDDEYDDISVSSPSSSSSFASTLHSHSTSSCTTISSSDSSFSNDDNSDYIILLNKIPCQVFCIEKLQGTLEDLLEDIKDIKTDVILSCIFQISFY